MMIIMIPLSTCYTKFACEWGLDFILGASQVEKGERISIMCTGMSYTALVVEITRTRGKA